MKTLELTGKALDWAVAKCEGFYPFTDGISWILEREGQYISLPQYSTDWAQGGAIIERELITLDVATSDYDEEVDRVVRLPKPAWYALIANGDEDEITARGLTPLEAAMRCYVLRNYGQEIDLPEGVK